LERLRDNEERATVAAWYRWEEKDLVIRLRVQPRANRDALGEVQGDRRRLRLRAAPVDGKANARLIQFLAIVFDVPPSRVILLAGQTSRDKRLRIRGPRKLPPGIATPNDKR
jgi:uncharacterized protein (TIGR00251 family)